MSKYGAQAVCDCGHPKRWHARRHDTAALVCPDERCACREYHQKYASTAEATRGAELEALQAAGDISGLIRQPRFALVVNNVKVCTYVGDFQYSERRRGQSGVVVEDVKGVRTAVYRIKRQLMKALYGIEILEVEV